MPSPFPGMDPYLENRHEWPNTHDFLIVGIAAALNAILPRRYQARTGERTYIVLEDPDGDMSNRRRVIVPDVAVRRKLRSNGRAGSVASIEFDEPLVLVAVPEEMREMYVDIVDLDDRQRLIAGIEVLSHANKCRGAGRKLYLKKQREMLRSKAHFLEIDLLRAGEHTAACPRPSEEHHGAWDYLISLHRAGQEFRYEVWTRTVRERLPRMKLPLSGKDEQVVLDLQEVLNRCYESGAFERSLNYSVPPDPPFSPEDAAWSKELLKRRS